MCLFVMSVVVAASWAPPLPGVFNLWLSLVLITPFNLRLYGSIEEIHSSALGLRRSLNTSKLWPVNCIERARERQRRPGREEEVFSLMKLSQTKRTTLCLSWTGLTARDDDKSSSSVSTTSTGKSKDPPERRSNLHSLSSSNNNSDSDFLGQKTTKSSSEPVI